MKLDDFIVMHGDHAKEMLEEHERLARINTPQKSVARGKGPESVRLEDRAGYLQKHARKLRSLGKEYEEILNDLDFINDRFTQPLEWSRVDKMARVASNDAVTDDVKKHKESELPRVVLPTDHKLMNEFAAEVGEHCAEHLYLMNDAVGCITYDQQRKRMSFVRLSSQSFISEVERYVLPIKRKIIPNFGTSEVPHSMTTDTAASVLASTQFREKLRPLRRINTYRAAVRRDNGTIELLPAGYDAESQTYTNVEVEFNEKMSFDKGKEIVEDLFSEFTFPDGERSKSVAVAALVGMGALQLLHHNALRPAFVVTKNDAGAGAGTLVECCLSPYFGSVAATTMPRGDAEEMDKLLQSLVKQGDQYVVFDNVKHTIGGASIEKFLSSPRYKGRTLGSNDAPEYDNNVSFYFTANGASVTPDMMRRCLFIILHQPERRAQDRKYRRSLTAQVFHELRPSILAAAWAFIRKWIQAGRQESSTVNPAFPEWSRIVGGVVEANGYASPLQRSEVAEEADEDTADMVELVSHMSHGRGYPAKEMVNLCRQHGLFLGLVGTSDLDMKPAHRSRFGKTLSRFHNRPVGDVLFTADGTNHSKQYKASALVSGGREAAGGAATPIPLHEKPSMGSRTSRNLTTSPTAPAAPSKRCKFDGSQHSQRTRARNRRSA